MVKRKCVMISSTARDLPEHRKEVMDACLRQGMFPVMMEHLPASDDEAISASLKMVDEADIYLGVFAYRYGYVPKEGNPSQISVTEMEYNRAVERKIPHLIFAMDKDHPLKIEDVEMGEGAAKLDVFKKRLLTDNIVNFFKSPADLRAHVINSLSQYRESDVTKFHYISDIPTPPEAYIAHPYTLLQTHRLIGRQAELNLLTNWVSAGAIHESPLQDVRIMNIVAIGGMGKSALTWKWFNDIAPQEMKPIAGRVWWSFYESDASFDNFIIRALAYVTQRSREEVQKISPSDREMQLLAVLDREPFLLVIDGLERSLIAYARMDAARLSDNQVSSQKNLRKTADPRVGSFLKKLAQVKGARILVSSRLYPAELETATGEPIPGCSRCDISGLTDEDAVELWRAFGISGSRDELFPIFMTFDKHPLLIQSLAGEVKRYHPAPGDFAKWRKANSRFDPTKFPKLQEAMGHVLEFALQGLNEKTQKVLHTIASFRMPASYDTLDALLLEKGSDRSEPKSKGKGRQQKICKPCMNDRELDAALTELEDRGLVGWDKRANRYDLHPIVRGVVWSGLPNDARKVVFTSLQAYFDSIQKKDFDDVNSLEDLTPVIELYNTLIGLGRYDDACDLFYNHLDEALLHHLNTILGVELLEALFPDELKSLPSLSRSDGQMRALNMLGNAYEHSGQPGRSIPLYRLAVEYAEKQKHLVNISASQANLTNALYHSSELYNAEALARRALQLNQKWSNRYGEATNLADLGISLAARGVYDNALKALTRASLMLKAQYKPRTEAKPLAHLVQLALWLNDFSLASRRAEEALRLACISQLERRTIRATRLQAIVNLESKNFMTANESLCQALSHARTVNLIEEELPTLIALAELRRRQKDLKAAYELLDDVWELAERGPYPLFHADAFNVFAQIERDAGNHAAAIEAATKAFRLAWCDGPPYAYHWGLEAARKHLSELGAPEPEMPAFDESKYEPMPEVEINPKDEFYVEEESGQ